MFTIVNVVHKMTIVKTRSRARAARTQEILEAALGIVEHDGLEALTIARLAAAMGWSVGAAYRYFASKDALLAALHGRVVTAYDAALVAEVLAPADRALDTVARVAAHYRRWLLARPGAHRLVAQTIADPRVLLPDAEGRRVLAEVRPVLVRLGALLARAAAEGDLAAGAVDRRVVVFWSAVNGALSSEKLLRFESSLRGDVILRDTVRALLVGWGARGAAADRAIARMEDGP